jgi:hypothetical protein
MRERDRQSRGDDATAEAESALDPGKQSLTDQLGKSRRTIATVPGRSMRTDALVQRKAGHEAGPSADQVHDAARTGVAGDASALPHRDAIQRSFGRHDISHVQAHTDDKAAAGASAMGADAFAIGDQIAFAGQPDLHTAAHEAAHVVQQRGGVQLKGGVGEVGDSYEQHADAVADLVVQGKSAEPLLDRYAGDRAGGAGSSAVQRHAFIGGTQVKSSDPDAKGTVGTFVKDDVVRSYVDKTELKAHAGNTTDYLGNLADGTWMRFHPAGINLLGENHTEVRLEMVVPAVNSKSFIYEPFAVDDLSGDLKTAFETENADRFKTFGVEKEQDKKQFGAESIYPKMGFNMSLSLPYFTGASPVKELTKKSGYIGQPVQRYLKIGWGHGKDVKAQVAQKVAAKQAVPPKLDELAKVVTAVEGTLDSFITGLVVDAWLGDELDKPANKKLLPSLAKFAVAFIDAMVEMAIGDPSSRMNAADKKKFGGATTDDEKQQLFSDWRNFKFEDSVKDAAKRGVRYAGMGNAHLDHLKNVGYPANGHPYDMTSAGKEMTGFKKETADLKAKAIKQP